MAKQAMANPIADAADRLDAIRRRFEAKLTPAGLCELFMAEACEAIDGFADNPPLSKVLELLQEAIDLTGPMPQLRSEQGEADA